MRYTDNLNPQSPAIHREPEEILNEFLEALDAQRKSETTIESYMMIVGKYIAMDSQYPFFSKQRVNQYLAEGRRDGNTGNTLRVKFYILKTFFRAFNEVYPFNKHDLPPPSPKHKPKISHDQMRRLEQVARSPAVTEKPVLRTRNWALVRMANALGLRRIEFQRMNIEDCFLNDESFPVEQRSLDVDYIMVQTAKHGRKVRRELDPDTAETLKRWIKLRTKRRVPEGQSRYWGGKQGEPTPLWTAGKTGGRLSLRSLSLIFQQIREEAGIDLHRAGFHASRRGRVTDLHDRGMTRPEITQEMGWENPTTVDTYILPDEARTKAKLRELHPYWRHEETNTEESDKDEVIKVEILSPKITPRVKPHTINHVKEPEIKPTTKAANPEKTKLESLEDHYDFLMNIKRRILSKE